MVLPSLGSVLYRLLIIAVLVSFDSYQNFSLLICYNWYLFYLIGMPLSSGNLSLSEKGSPFQFQFFTES
jgi:hypothetical protein